MKKTLCAMLILASSTSLIYAEEDITDSMEMMEYEAAPMSAIPAAEPSQPMMDQSKDESTDMMDTMGTMGESKKPMMVEETTVEVTEPTPEGTETMGMEEVAAMPATEPMEQAENESSMSEMPSDGMES